MFATASDAAAAIFGSTRFNAYENSDKQFRLGRIAPKTHSKSLGGESEESRRHGISTGSPRIKTLTHHNTQEPIDVPESLR